MRLYYAIKTDVKLENYLIGQGWFWARSQLARLRSGTHRLRVETGRHERPPLDRKDRVCLRCEFGEVDDESHYLLRCGAFTEERKLMVEAITEITKQRFPKQNDILSMRVLIGDQMTVELESIVLRFINNTLRRGQ